MGKFLILLKIFILKTEWLVELPYLHKMLRLTDKSHSTQHSSMEQILVLAIFLITSEFIKLKEIQPIMQMSSMTSQRQCQ